MPADNDRRGELKDLNEKVDNAKQAANAPDAGDREKADLKLLEQAAAAEKLKARRPAPPRSSSSSGVDAKLDKALKDSFPGSDPVSFVQAAPIKKGDRDLSTVKAKDAPKG